MDEEYYNKQFQNLLDAALHLRREVHDLRQEVRDLRRQRCAYQKLLAEESTLPSGELPKREALGKDAALLDFFAECFDLGRGA